MHAVDKHFIFHCTDKIMTKCTTRDMLPRCMLVQELRHEVLAVRVIHSQRLSLQHCAYMHWNSMPAPIGQTLSHSVCKLQQIYCSDACESKAEARGLSCNWHRQEPWLTRYIHAAEKHARRCCADTNLSQCFYVQEQSFPATDTCSHRDEASSPKLRLIATERPRHCTHAHRDSMPVFCAGVAASCMLAKSCLLMAPTYLLILGEVDRLQVRSSCIGWGVYFFLQGTNAGDCRRRRTAQWSATM